MPIITFVDHTIPVAADFNDSYSFVNTEVRTYERGGTGLSSYTKGDILYASAANTVAKLAIGGYGQVLCVDATGIPTWTTRSLHKSGTNRGPSTSDLSVFGGALTIAANSLGTANCIRTSIRASLDNSTGGSSNYTLKVTYGGTTVGMAGPTVAVPNLSANFIYNATVYFFADASASAQKASAVVSSAGNALNYGYDSSVAAFAIDSTASQAFNIVISNSAVSSQTVLYAQAVLLA